MKIELITYVGLMLRDLNTFLNNAVPDIELMLSTTLRKIC